MVILLTLSLIRCFLGLRAEGIKLHAWFCKSDSTHLTKLVIWLNLQVSKKIHLQHIVTDKTGFLTEKPERWNYWDIILSITAFFLRALIHNIFLQIKNLFDESYGPCLQKIHKCIFSYNLAHNFGGFIFTRILPEILDWESLFKINPSNS